MSVIDSQTPHDGTGRAMYSVARQKWKHVLLRALIKTKLTSTPLLISYAIEFLCCIILAYHLKMVK